MRASSLLFVPTFFVAIPLVAFAAPENFKALVDLVVGLINNAFVPLIFALAFITFIWGAFQYFFYPSEDNKQKGREFIIWGIVGMFVMISVWGLVNIVVNTILSSPSPGGPI